jgi:glyoxylase-like metal-dependent hydrolase (beta-lactamase superfamily II)
MVSMFFKQIHAKEATLSYLYGCGSLGKGVVVDPVLGDENRFLEEAEGQKVKITHVIDTHIHADHYSGGRRLAEMAGAEYCIHESNLARVRYPFRGLRDGETIEAGNVLIRVIHTPGHTPDSISLLVTDKRRGETPWFINTGDTLFVGSIGRPDLAGEGREWASLLYDSLHNRLLSLPDTIELFPGHQAGSVCGAGISGKPSSTIGFEKSFNRGLRISNREEFIDYLLKDIPSRPEGMERMVAYNTGESGDV